jgi:predicted ATPase/transcriptional regulator with XRE-family HTH domain
MADRGHATFGAWLRGARHEYGYTQQELGNRAHCSAALIRKIEAGLRRPSRPVAEGILAALEVPAPERPALLKLALHAPADAPVPRAGAGPRPARADPPSTPRPDPRLPVPLTTLIGREAPLAALITLLKGDARLVTLVGPPGIGKTRLALAAGAGLAPAFAAGVYFAALAPICDPTLLPAVLAGVLSVSEVPGRALAAVLRDFLRERETLLVLDNFEQIVGAAPLLLDLLAACPRLKLLVTSREALHVRGEQLFLVPALGTPDDAAGGAPAALQAYPAVALFVERAAAVDPAFALTPENAPAVAAITRQLGGLPLALELAAARSRYLTPQAIARRLHQSLSLLTGGPRDLPTRQQTLRAAIAWSYDLLDAGEQTLFRRLGVFAGALSLSAVEAVCNATADLPFAVFDGLADLVDKSLLQQSWDAQGEPRFRMLEMIREFAAETLAASAEGHAIHRLCAEYYVGLVQAAASELGGRRQAIWLDRLEAEYDNLRAVQRWTLTTGAPDLALPLAAALWRFWDVRGHWSEALTWLEALLAHPGAAAPTLARAHALLAAARLIHWVRRAVEGRALAEEALAIGQEQGDQAIAARALNLLANIHLEEGQPAAAARLYESVLATGRAAGELRLQAAALVNLCYLDQQTGDLARAERYGEEGRALFQRLGDDFGCSTANARLGEIALATGRPALAGARLEEALAQLAGLAHVPGLAAVHALLARALTEQDRPDAARPHLITALRLLRSAHETRHLPAVLTEVAHLLLARGGEREGAVLLACAAAQHRSGPAFAGPAAGVFLAELHARTLALLDPAVLRAARDAGEALSPDQAIARALAALGGAA